MKRKKTIICIDSFKPEYLKHAPFLQSLTKHNKHGRLRFPPGFEGGMQTFFEGKSSALALFYHSKNSSLRWTRKFIWLGPLINLPINLIRLLKREELFLIRNIPYKKIWMFDFSIASFKKPENVKYIYIGKLDKVAHRHGTNAGETIACIKKIDKKLSKTRFDLVLSDHGMLNIKETTNVPETKTCFIDSTMAKYWGSKNELEEIRKRLPMKKGKLISWPDKRYGQLIFLANPAVLILPNYWQGNKPCKAMHGYTPTCKDMDGFYLLKQEGKRKDMKIKELRKESGCFI